MGFRASILTMLAVTVACGGKAEKLSGQNPQDGRWGDRVFYEVFVRSFADSNGDGRGDLAGLTARLDQLNDGDPSTSTDLGVEALWLMPIMTSPSYHGYDVTNYVEVEPDYGTLADFDALTAAAHARGIKVILDFVANHTSSQHPWFVDSVQGVGGRRDWYEWSATDPGWKRPWDGASGTWHPQNGAWYYGVFTASMPDLKLDTPAVEDALVSAMTFWLDHGADGFRLDAARYLVETGPGAGQADSDATHAFLKRLRARLAVKHADVFLVGEVWTALERAALYRGAGDELSAVFAFDAAAATVSGLASGNAGNLSAALGRANAALPGHVDFQAPFLTNHDQVRIARQVGGEAAALRLGAAILLAQPGPPFLYYGEELGMMGGASSDDRDKRTPMRWDAALPYAGFTTGSPWYLGADEAAGVDVAAQRVDPGSLWNLYRRLIALRRATPALAGGDLALPSATGGGDGLLALVRTLDGKRVLFVANLGKAPTGAFTLNVQGTPTVLLAEGLSTPPSPAAGALAFPDLAARGWAYLTLN
ncbi:MAG: alpha-amylase family glycosyl hydrolase [Anaeromyxobacteraceae bacterium]